MMIQAVQVSMKSMKTCNTLLHRLFSQQKCSLSTFKNSDHNCRCGKTNCDCYFATTTLTKSAPYYKIRGSTSRHLSSTSTSNPDLDPLQVLLKNNKEWVDQTNAENPEYFKEVGAVHKPKYLYFGCSDARVPANTILGLGPGDVFVHRNIGNQVPVNDLNALSVLEYAVGVLGVTDIIVAGHYDCGAVRGATSRQSLGLLDTWLRLVKDVYRLHKDHLDMIENDEERHKRLVELNVVEQCLNLYKTNIVQNKRHETSKFRTSEGIYPRIHPVVFTPREGILKSLNYDMQKRAAALDSIYGFKDNDKKL